MSTHKIGFNEDLTKIIFQLSSDQIRTISLLLQNHAWWLLLHKLTKHCKNKEILAHYIL